MVTLYTKPACVQCTATKRALDKKGIDYNPVDISVDETALATLKGLGYQQAPVLTSPIGDWSGFNPEKIDELADYFSQPVG